MTCKTRKDILTCSVSVLKATVARKSANLRDTILLHFRQPLESRPSQYHSPTSQRCLSHTPFRYPSLSPFFPCHLSLTPLSQGLVNEQLDWRAFGIGGPKENLLDPACFKITVEDITLALTMSKPSSDPSSLAEYRQWTRDHGEKHESEEEDGEEDSSDSQKH